MQTRLQRMPTAQNMLDPSGIQADRVESFWWFALIVGAAVLIAVVGTMLYAAFRKRPAIENNEQRHANERKMTRYVAGGVIATAIILLVFLAVDFATGRASGALSQDDDALVIDIIGHQWWWEIRYADPTPSRILTSANELRVPTGRTIRLRMVASDVIHSLWIPSIHGKKDLIPGHTTVTNFRADEPGVFRGQCAEFCGHQHANMGIVLIAQPPDEFAAWYERQLLPAPAPTDSTAARGQQVFLQQTCIMCHTIRGTPAGGKVAPDLTHIGSRLTLGAATLPNTRGHFAGWISNSQKVKPGNRMPPNQLAPDDLQALLTYLQSLQ